MAQIRPYGLRFTLAVLAAVIGLLSLAACGGSPQVRISMPEFLDDAPSRVVSAYQYALHKGHDLENYPCYCGCVDIGHENNRDCYIESMDADGNVVWDSHAKTCGVCVDITQDARELVGQGWSSVSVREFIDSKYSPVGPPTNTPWPAN